MAAERPGIARSPAVPGRPPHDAPFAPATVERVRRDTPSTSQWIHLDNAGASPSPEPVHRRIVAHLDAERELGGYAAARDAEAELDGLYDVIARFLNARREEIAFAENASRAWDQAFHAVRFRPGDRILTSRAEYGSSFITFLRLARQREVRIDLVPDDVSGGMDVAALGAMLDDRVRVVNVCHAPTSNGLANDAERIGAALRGHPALYFLDACQSVGQVAIDVRRIGCHVLSATGRKYLRGPRGTGFLYVRSDLIERLEPPFIDMRAADWTAIDTYELRRDAVRFETWESSVAGRLGLKAAVEYAEALGIEAIQSRIASLAAQLRRDLATIPGVHVRDRGLRRTGIVTFDVDGVEALALRERLRRERVIAGVIEPGDARLDLAPQGGTPVVRAAVHYFNTDEELARFVQIVEAIATGRRPPRASDVRA